MMMDGREGREVNVPEVTGKREKKKKKTARKRKAAHLEAPAARNANGPFRNGRELVSYRFWVGDSKRSSFRLGGVEFNPSSGSRRCLSSRFLCNGK